MHDRAKVRTYLDKYLRKKEGEKLKPYLCIAGVPTIGVGATTYPDGRKVTLQDPPITVEQMNEMLAYEIERAINEVLTMTNQICTSSQLVALCLLGYNIGFPSLAKSTVIRKHNKGDYAAAAHAFRLWNKYRDPKTKQLVDSPALLSRRLFESALYMQDAAAAPLPQAVTPESSLTRSPLAQAGSAVTALGSAGAIVAPAADPAPTPAQIPASSLPEVLGQAATASGQIQEIAAAFSLNPTVLACLALVALGGVILYWRWKQRDGGYA